jgi:eukaryotic-like serine/threonine-protein kinase
VPYLKTEFNEGGARFSPDGRWVAYHADGARKYEYEIYVQSFPQPSGAIRVSSGGGSEPRWRRDGKELFYLGPGGQLMAVDVTTVGSFKVSSSPRRLFGAPIFGGPLIMNSWDVAGDGKRFIVRTNVEAKQDPGSVTIVLNWPSTLSGR